MLKIQGQVTNVAHLFQFLFNALHIFTVTTTVHQTFLLENILGVSAEWLYYRSECWLLWCAIFDKRSKLPYGVEQRINATKLKQEIFCLLENMYGQLQITVFQI